MIDRDDAINRLVPWLYRQIDTDEAALEGTSPGPWVYDSYSKIVSVPKMEPSDAWWDEVLATEHTVERGGDCPACGGWREPSELTPARGHGCKLHSDDYALDPIVAYVLAYAGDTALGSRIKDAQHIEEWHPARIHAECDAARRRVAAVAAAFQIEDAPAEALLIALLVLEAEAGRYTSREGFDPAWAGQEAGRQ